MHCTSGGGVCGFLSIVMATAPYLLHAGEHFLLPEHPVTQPRTHIATASQSQITVAKCHYDTSLDVFCRYYQIRKALQQQIRTVIHPIY